MTWTNRCIAMILFEYDAMTIFFTEFVFLYNLYYLYPKPYCQLDKPWIISAFIIFVFLLYLKHSKSKST